MLFWFGLPLLVLYLLVVPETSAIFVSWAPFGIESNTLQSSLRPVLAEALHSYVATLLSLAALVVVLAAFRSQARYLVRADTSIPLYIPVLVYGVEATRHIENVLRRHYWVENPPRPEVVFLDAALGSLVVFLVVLATCSLAAWLVGLRWGRLPRVPAFSLAVFLAVSVNWVSIWLLLRGPAG